MDPGGEGGWGGRGRILTAKPEDLNWSHNSHDGDNYAHCPLSSTWMLYLAVLLHKCTHMYKVKHVKNFSIPLRNSTSLCLPCTHMCIQACTQIHYCEFIFHNLSVFLHLFFSYYFICCSNCKQVFMQEFFQGMKSQSQLCLKCISPVIYKWTVKSLAAFALTIYHLLIVCKFSLNHVLWDTVLSDFLIFANLVYFKRHPVIIIPLSTAHLNIFPCIYYL